MDRGDCGSAFVEDGGRDRVDPDVEFLVDPREAVGSDLAEALDRFLATPLERFTPNTITNARNFFGGNHFATRPPR
jgi:hypothetical protein